MRFDIQRIDDRIKKLQELRNLLSDPEMSTMLSEFVSGGGEEDLAPAPVLMPSVAPVEAPGPDMANQILNEVVNGGETHHNGGLWNRRGR